MKRSLDEDKDGDAAPAPVAKKARLAEEAPEAHALALATAQPPPERLSARLGLTDELTRLVDQIEAKNKLNLEIIDMTKALFAIELAGPNWHSCYRIGRLALESGLLSVSIVQARASSISYSDMMKANEISLFLPWLGPLDHAQTQQYLDFSKVRSGLMPRN